MLIMFNKKIDEIEKRIGANVKAAREAARLTQADIAKVLGCSQGNVAHYEAGRRPLTCAMIKAIADKIGVHPSTFVDPSPVNDIYVGVKPEHIELAKKAIEVLQSETFYAESLLMNIESFYKAVHQEINNVELKDRVTAIERSLRERPPALGGTKGDTSFQKSVPSVKQKAPR